MSYALIARRIPCPYCAETIQVQLDMTAGDQEYIEDCHVCCQPILIRYTVDDGELTSVDATCSG
jgi:hypothetical protein